MYQEFEAKPLQYRATRATNPKVSMDHHDHHHHHHHRTHQKLNLNLIRTSLRLELMSDILSAL